MLHLEDITFEAIAVHHVGNKSMEQGYQLTDSLVETGQDALHDVLKSYFIASIASDEIYRFKNEVSLSQNEIYHLSRLIFQDPSLLLEHSKKMAAHLYEHSTHPRIKPGELYVVFFNQVIVGDEVTEAIGIFKSEVTETFLQVDINNQVAHIAHLLGIAARKPDKSCIILNIEQEDGYRVCMADHLNRSSDNTFWKEDFLDLQPVGNDFFQTNQFLNLTKQFVTKQLPQEFDSAKSDQIDLLNKSMDYFKSHEVLDRAQFKAEVFSDPQIQEAFESFESQYQSDFNIDLDETFSISAPALKKQSRIYKSVIKLDKNFHIYVHGNKELIEQGTDETGRKFYKLYYTEES